VITSNMRNDQYTLEDFFYELPPELIAQHPQDKRDSSRLFVLDRSDNSYTHTGFSRLPEFLRKGDLLVLNDAKVIHARIPCRRQSGGIIELLLTRQIDDRRWLAITNRTKRLKPEETVRPVADDSIEIIIRRKRADAIEIEANRALDEPVLSSIGQIALPPYIKRDADEMDRERYQTVYARESGAVAAPTAGLHFTGELFEKIRAMGAETVFITLHVSWGTFQPVRARQIRDHRMHSEKYVVSHEAAAAVNAARKNRGRVIAVGTTSLRVLESTYRNGLNIPGEGETDIFIYPPKKVLSADCLLTNFHTPYSTLLMLVASFAGYDTIMSAYREAVSQRYRFFSYGDAMFIA
jgi:S-adenosylmethionine:tRNA ribosyltransferase-isomerase